MELGNIAIVGGTGFEDLPPDIFAEPLDIETSYGSARVLSVSDNYTEPYRLYFLPRHGSQHALAPHQINYRANALALRQLGVRFVFATNAVGSLRLDLPTGAFVAMDDFVDFTRHRPITLYGETHWSHTDLSLPYSPLLRKMLLDAAQSLAVPIVTSGTYICCDGPRFESPAEVRLFRQWGGDIVGMTGLPEVVFAREAGMEYAAIAIVTNLGAGLSASPVDHTDVVRNMASALPLLREITMTAARRLVASWSENVSRE